MHNFRNNIAKTLAGLSEADIVVEFVKKSGDHRYGFFCFACLALFSAEYWY